MKFFIALSVLALQLVFAFAADRPVPSSNGFGITNFIWPLDTINAEIAKIKTPIAYDRLLSNIRVEGRQVHKRLDRDNNNLINQINGNSVITDTQRASLLTELSKAYQAGSAAIDKEVADQTKAVNDALDKIDIKGLVASLNKIINDAVTKQTATATEMSKISATFTTNMDGVYEAIEKTIRQVLATKA